MPTWFIVASTEAIVVLRSPHELVLVTSSFSLGEYFCAGYSTGWTREHEIIGA